MNSLDLADRAEAGRALAQAMLELHTLHDPLVMAVPRGGVPVGREVAMACQAPLDLMGVARIRMPEDDISLGAVTAGGVATLAGGAMRLVDGDATLLEAQRRRAVQHAEHRTASYRAHLPALTAYGRDVVLVDDVVRSGSTIIACLGELAERGARRVIVAVPVAHRRVLNRIRHHSDGVVALCACDDGEDPASHYRSRARVLDVEVVVDVRATREHATAAIRR